VTAARRAWLRAGVVLACVVLVDQITKRLVDSSIAPGEHRSLLPGVELVHAVNHGIAFSVSAGGPGILVAVIGVAIAAILGYFATHAERRLLWLPAGLMLGGAIGNLVDRVRADAVTDFVKLPHWPAFNIADMSITVGVFALLYVLREDAAPRPG